MGIFVTVKFLGATKIIKNIYVKVKVTFRNPLTNLWGWGSNYKSILMKKHRFFPGWTSRFWSWQRLESFATNLEGKTPWAIFKFNLLFTVFGVDKFPSLMGFLQWGFKSFKSIPSSVFVNGRWGWDACFGQRCGRGWFFGLKNRGIFKTIFRVRGEKIEIVKVGSHLWKKRMLEGMLLCFWPTTLRLLCFN